MTIKIINKYLSTLLFCLPFIGYQSVTSLFLQDSATMEDAGTLASRAVTVPYRAFVLMLSIVLIIINRKVKIIRNNNIKLFFLFWGLLLLRIFYDLQYQTEHPVDVNSARQTWLYVLFICLIPTVAVLKSINYINFKIAFRAILIGYVLLIPVFYYNNPLLFSSISIGRISGNIALNTISFGHWGGGLFLLAFFASKDVNKFYAKLFFYALLLVGLFILLRAGSRGPFIAFISFTSFYFASRQKQAVLSIIVMFLLLLFCYVFEDFLFDLIRNVSPVLAARLTPSTDVLNSYELYSNGRASLYSIAIDNTINNPFLGKSFAIFNATSGTYIYSHNVVLDAFMALGILGGFLFLTILCKALMKSWLLIKYDSPQSWICLLAVQQIVAHMFSGAFYQSDILNVLLVTLFMLPTSLRKDSKRN